MITTEMTATEILKEVKKDMPHVLHALHKGYGGKRYYEADERRMAKDVLREPEGSVLLGNVESCTCGKTGNRWIIYSYAQNTGFQVASTGHYEFLWWEATDGSISAMQFADASADGHRQAIHYSGHFFQRYAERENLGPVDLQLVIDFMRQNGHGVFQAEDEPTKPGEHRFDIILRNGIGRGYTSGMEVGNPKLPFMSHVRTYLPNAMLNPKQREMTAEARAIQASKSRPADTFVNKIVADDVQGLCDYFADFFISRGMPGEAGRMFANLMDQIITNEVVATATTGEQRTESALRATLLRSYHRYQQPVFEYVVSHPSRNLQYSMLDAITVAKVANPDLSIRAMLTAMFSPKPDDHDLLNYIERTSAKFEAKYQEGIATGKIKTTYTSPQFNNLR